MRFDGLDGDGTKNRPRKVTSKELVTFRLNPLVTDIVKSGEQNLGGYKEDPKM